MREKKPRPPSPEEAAVLLYEIKMRGYEGTVERLDPRTRLSPAWRLSPAMRFSSSHRGSQTTDELFLELINRRNHAIHGQAVDMDAVAELFIELADRSEPPTEPGTVTRPEPEPDQVTEWMPPLGAEQLLHLFLSKSDREELIGDLEEEYRTVILPRFGPRFARTWYWTQALRSIVPMAWTRLIRLAKMIAFLRIFRWIARPR